MMKAICRQRALWILAVLLFVVWILPSHASAEAITSTLNLVNVRQNERGDGYNWANRYDVLTLSGIDLETESDYGLRLPQNCTVVLEGTNYIKAAKYALTCSGNVTFKGSGKLILEGGEIGLYIYTEVGTDKIRLVDGNYEITAGRYGVYSTAADFSFVDGTMDISVSSPDGAAVAGRCLNLVGGRFTANNSVEATHELVVEGINLEIESARPALSAPILSVKAISVDYKGENTLSARSTAKRDRPSAVFGEGVPGYVDYILLAVFALGIVAAIVLPILRRKKKTKELYERLANEGEK